MTPIYHFNMNNLPKIYGFNKTSEMGLNLFAPSIFLGGCNLRCKYCMNHKLIQPADLKEVSLDIIRQHIQENKCEWINISGGEPTCHAYEKLMNLINEFKALGCKIGMSTNGTIPDSLRGIISHLNYVALDIKSNRYAVYDDISTDSNYNFTGVIISHSILVQEKNKRQDFDFEVRTTLFPSYIDAEGLREIGQMLRSGDKWVLQQFRNNVSMLESKSSEITPYDNKQLNDILEQVKHVSSNVHLRYV